MADGYKPGKGMKIEKLYAWIATEPDGGEGIIASSMGGGMMIALVGADPARIESLRDHAAAAGKAAGLPVRLVEFSNRIDHGPAKKAN